MLRESEKGDAISWQRRCVDQQGLRDCKLIDGICSAIFREDGNDTEKYSVSNQYDPCHVFECPGWERGMFDRN